MRIFVDVEDLFDYARNNKRPSGIQRLAFEIYRELATMPAIDGREIVFVRHAPGSHALSRIAFADVDRLFAALSSEEIAREPGGLAKLAASTKARARDLARSLPFSLRRALSDLVRTHVAAGRAWANIGRAGFKAAGKYLRVHGPRRDGAAAGQAIVADAGPGDVYLALGSPWSNPVYGKLLATLKERGLFIGIMVYDLIPVVRPEWCDRTLVRAFEAWLAEIVPLTDHFFTISKHSGEDLVAHARRALGREDVSVSAVPIGASFGAAQAPVDAAALPARDFGPQGYVLFVSTIEARKNHLLAFRVWRRLIEALGPENVPTLVFAGRKGWLVEDLFKQLENCAWLGGKIVHVAEPSDAELVGLYRHCRFTLFPSLYEGWGLPVTESHVFGKACVTSRRTSMPEAGGDFAFYLEPDDVSDAFAVLRDLIENPQRVAAAEARLASDFAPPSWRDTAEHVLARAAGPAATASPPAQEAAAG